MSSTQPFCLDKESEINLSLSSQEENTVILKISTRMREQKPQQYFLQSLGLLLLGKTFPGL